MTLAAASNISWLLRVPPRAATVGGFLHFRPRRGQQKLVPFVTGGYTLFFRSRTANGFNFGSGVNYWFREHPGLGLEFRDNLWTTWGTAH
jgi:hypothetical protein